MQSFFSAEFFSRNRQSLRAKLPEDYPIILSANGHLQRTSDTTFPFAQDSNFWYLTGLNQADIVLVIEPNTEYIILPPANAMIELFDGAISKSSITERSGVRDVMNAKDGWHRLKASLAEKKNAYTILPSSLYITHYGFYTNPSKLRLVAKLKRQVNNLKLHSLRNEMVDLRSIKQPSEILALNQAIAITTATLADLRSSKNLSAYKYEFELEAAITAGFRSRGATGHAYSPIIASGSHAATIHYIDNNGVMDPSDLIVADVGAEVEHYSADVTRTLCLTKPSSRQQAILDAVRDVQLYALSLLKPGLLYRDYENAVAKYMGQQLVKLKLVEGNPTEKEIRHYYPHATSHFLGLDTHDLGDYTKPFEQNMVLTCEPGIYIPEEGIGVRLEDDVIITQTGVKNLTGDCSYEAYSL